MPILKYRLSHVFTNVLNQCQINQYAKYTMVGPPRWGGGPSRIIVFNTFAMLRLWSANCTTEDKNVRVEGIVPQRLSPLRLEPCAGIIWSAAARRRFKVGGSGGAPSRKVGGAKMKSAAGFGGACGLILSQIISVTLSTHFTINLLKQARWIEEKRYKFQAQANGIIKVVNYFKQTI